MGSAINQSLPISHFEKLYRGVRNNQPEVIGYFSVDGQDFWANVNGLRVPIVKTSVDSQLIKDWLNPWAAKLGYALWYEHCQKPLSQTGGVGIRWMSNQHVIEGNFPHEVFNNLGNSGEVKQGTWTTSEQFYYRFAINADERFAFFMPIMFQSCGVLIYIFEDKTQLDRFPKMTSYQTSAAEGIHRYASPSVSEIL